jgi:hypothetical protein
MRRDAGISTHDLLVRNAESGRHQKGATGRSDAFAKQIVQRLIR